MKTNHLFILVILFIYNYSHSQNKNIPFFNESIQIDGKLDEGIWKNAQVFDGFNNFFPVDKGSAKKDTKVYVYYNENYLFIGAQYFDDTNTNTISTLKRDNHGDGVVNSDSFGIVLDPFNKENNGYYFVLNASNVQLDALIDFNGTDYNINESWNSVWNSATGNKDNIKVYEFAIPLKALNFDTNNTSWGIQFFTRDFKTNVWTTYVPMTRNFFQFDLRFTESINFEKLPKKNSSKFTLTPSITYTHENQTINNTTNNTFTPSLDLQYNITPSLRLDATINPDFSQVDVDQQVVNLTRFAINFPERRNFFLENSDLFNNLGTFGVNPFYSRIIGGTTKMQFGLKLSGNISPTTRIGILNAQTEKNSENKGQNYTVLVGRQKLSKAFTATAYLVNRQQTNKLALVNDYNRVLGANLNYKSKNSLWSSQLNYAKSFSNNLKTKNSFFNIEGQYNTRTTFFKGAFKSVEKNFVTEVGFTPRLYNYNPENNKTIRDSYLDSYFIFQKTHYPKQSKLIDSYRYLSITNDAFWNSNGTLTEMTTKIGNTLRFKKNLSALYFNLNHNYFNLIYGFDILNNSNPILPGEYNTIDASLGYDNWGNNSKFYYATEAFYGGYFNGNRSGFNTSIGYRLLPFANLSTSYTLNHLDLNSLGKETFHLAQFTGEVFFNNRLNWTTYVQYNTQQNNFNINSRLQWEYKPLSYVYLVLTDNFNKHIHRTNWGISFKMNYRFDF